VKPQIKLLITGIVASLIPVIAFEVQQAIERYGANSRQAIYIGAFASAVYAVYKYLRPSPVDNTDHNMSTAETFKTAGV
jgi:hypothetical protein